MNYRKIPKISPGLMLFKGPFRGAYIRRGLCTEGNLRFKIDWAGLILGRKFTVFLFYLEFEGNLQVQAPGEAYIWRGVLTEGFCVTSLGALYLEGLIFGILRYILSVQQCFIATSVPGSSLTRNLHKQPTIMKSVYHLIIIS